jgi:hypothetical protein
MAELNRNRKHDYEYRARQFDDSPIVVDIGQSITEMRSIYANLTDHEFAAWYAGRYRVEGGTKAVIEYLQRKQAQRVR